MPEHLLVVRLDALRSEDRRNPTVLVCHQRHRPDVEFGAAIHRAGAGKIAAAEANNAPLRLDRGLAGVTHFGANAAIEQRALP